MQTLHFRDRFRRLSLAETSSGSVDIRSRGPMPSALCHRLPQFHRVPSFASKHRYVKGIQRLTILLSVEDVDNLLLTSVKKWETLVIR